MTQKTLCILFSFLICELFQSCQSTARLSDFTPSAKAINFNKIAASKLEGKGSKTESEYYIKTNSCTDSLLTWSIIRGLREENFTIKATEQENRAVFGERGMRANEWNAVAGVYYEKDVTGFQIYIRCKITQDFTGGFREDRAMKIGSKICQYMGNCVNAYSVSTQTNY